MVSNGDPITWALLAAGVGLGLLGLMLLYAALLRDRSRGRPRCPKCWYDMAGRDMAAQCPECGRPISTRRSLFRTRRRWWLAVVALVMLAAAWPMLQWERIKRDGWLSVTPTTVLIARQALRRPDAPTFDPAEIELWSRLSKDAKRTSGLPADHVWDWQWHLLYEINRRRASRFPDVGYFPVGREPRVEYGAADLYMMLALLDASGRRPESIAAFLERFGPELMMLDPPRERWPEGAAIPLTPRVIPAWGEPNRYRMRVEFEDPDMSSNQTLRPGTHYLRCAVELSLKPKAESGQAVPLGTFQLAHTVRVAGSNDDVVQPVRDLELDEELASGLRILTAGQPLGHVALVLDGETASRFDDICVAFRLAWMRDGTEVAVTDPDVIIKRLDRDGTPYYASHSVLVPRTYNESVLDGWSLRLVPDQEAALHMSMKDRYWAGEVTIPFEIDPDPGIAW